MVTFIFTPWKIVLVDALFAVTCDYSLVHWEHQENVSFVPGVVVFLAIKIYGFKDKALCMVFLYIYVAECKRRKLLNH